MVDKVRQSDTYHAIAHQLGHWVVRLEKAACNAIEFEDECFKKLNSACTDRVINRRIEQFEDAQKVADEAIDLYEAYKFLYNCLVEEIQPFNSKGNLRDRKEAEENIKIALDLIETLGKAKLTDAVKKVRRTLPNLLHYFDVAQKIVGELEKLGINQDALRALCLAWQWNKAKIKSKQTNRTRQCTKNESICLEFAIGHLQEDFENVKELVHDELDQIVQSSALVECINSIIRPYLNTSKNQITQETLNLIMFYHNHRRYKAGKRKGKTPMEILTGKKQNKDWIKMIFDIIEEYDPSFFASLQ